MSMGFEVIVEEAVMDEMRVESERTLKRALVGDDFDDDHEEDVRELVLENAGALRIDETTGRIPKEDWGTIDLVVCLGGDGVGLHASKLFQGPGTSPHGFPFRVDGFPDEPPAGSRWRSRCCSQSAAAPRRWPTSRGAFPSLSACVSSAPWSRSETQAKQWRG